MSASAGRVLLIFKGDYESATTYKPLDVVIYGVNSYVCLLQSTGNVPTNTTYWQILAKGISNMSPEAIGIGYGLSQNSGASKTATLADYTLTINGIVAVTFAEDVPANATLNINSQGAKPIYYRGSAIVANVIRGGDTVTFAYDGTHYDILCIDGGAGHEIENASGTKLTQRDVLKFTGGLKASDNPTSQETEIDDTPDYINWTNWNAKTDEEKNAYIASHNNFAIDNLPDTEGVINAEYMTLLWENPNTTQSFASQTITLNSADYDFYYVSALIYSSATPEVVSGLVKKGLGCFLTFGSAGARLAHREITYVSDTSLNIGNCSTSLGMGTVSTDNTRLIPTAIYGIKKDFQFKVNAIATELSTRADHCFLSDELTTVEDAITYKDVYSTDEHVVGKWIDGSTLYERTFYVSGLPNNTSVNITHNISNVKLVVEYSGIGFNGSTSFPLPRTGTNYIDISANETYLTIVDSGNYSGWSAYITLRYIKTS